MSFLLNPYRFGTSKRVFGVVGDSNADGRGASIPVVASNTLYKWNTGTSLYDAITTQTVANNGSYGSIYQQFATGYKALTGQAVYLVNGANGGSEFYPNGDNNNWYTSGTLYAAFTAQMTNALSAAFTSAPTAIFLNLGINDLRGGLSTANIQTGITSLLDRLTTDYPGVPILVINIGRAETGTFNSQAFYDIRSYLVNQARSRTDVYIISNAAQFIQPTGMYQGDDLHYTQTMNDIIGNSAVSWFTNSSMSKESRSVIASSFSSTSFNANQLSLIQAVVNAQVSNGNWVQLEAFYSFRVITKNDIYWDWTLKGFGTESVGALTFNANDNINPDGSATWYTPSYVNSIYTSTGAGRDDLIEGVKLYTNSVPAGTSGVLMGKTPGSGAQIRLAQSTTNCNYHVNVASGTTRSVAGTTLTGDTWHQLARNGGTEYWLMDTTTHDSFATASNGANSETPRLGAGGTQAVAALFMNVTLGGYFAAKYSTLNQSALVSGTNSLEYLLDHWND